MRLLSFFLVAMLGLVSSIGCDSGGTPAGSGGATGAAGSGGAGHGGAGGTNAGGTCQAGCTATLAANCAQGPATQAKCETDCALLMTGACGTTYRALQACAEGKAITCSAAGIPAIAACAAEQNAFVACLN